MKLVMHKTTIDTMKIKLSLLVLFVMLMGAGTSYAQLSKDEAKEWKKRAKDYKKNPEQLKALVEEGEDLKGQVSSLNNQVENLQSQLSDKNAQISSLRSDMQEMKAQLAAAQQKVASMQSQPKQKPTVEGDEGVWFKVQVGAFKNIDMSEYFKNNPNFSGEQSEEGYQRITLGRFRDYWEADKFKKALRDMGVKEAWIVPYKDGTRVPLKQVLENISERPETSAGE